MTIRVFVAAVLAGVVGAVVWAAVVYFSGYELGLIAWAIGGLVGFAALSATGRSGTTTTGVIAAAVAALSVVGGKWMVASIVTNDVLRSDAMVIAMIADVIIEEHREQGEEIIKPNARFAETIKEEYPPLIWSMAESRWQNISESERAVLRDAPELANPELPIVWIADEIAEERLSQVDSINGWTYHDQEMAWRGAHYPAEIWDETVQRWEAMSPDDQALHEAQIRDWLIERNTTHRRTITPQVRLDIFTASFGAFDLIWLLLAVATAFQMGRMEGESA